MGASWSMIEKWHRSAIFLGVASMPCRLEPVGTFETQKGGAIGSTHF